MPKKYVNKKKPIVEEVVPKKTSAIEVEGKVLEVLPGGDFKVKLDNGHIVEARVSGKMRLNMIRIYPGDTVLMEIPICDLTRGRIIYRK